MEIDEALAPGDQWTTFVGEGKRVSLMPVSAGRFYFFFDVPLPAGLAEDRDTLRADLSRYFAGWAPPVQKLIAALDPQTTNRIEIHDIEPFSRLGARPRRAARRCRTQHHPGYWPGRLRGDGRCSGAGRRFPPDPRYCGRPARV